MTMVDVTCAQCGKIYQREAKKVRWAEKQGWKQYCSRECHSESKSKSIDTYCACCGEPIKVSKAIHDRSKSGLNYCSHSCAITINNTLRKGEKHPNFTDGESIYRQIALEYYGSKCSVCGYDIEMCLEVHHKDCNRKNNEIENLDVLCPTHHKEYQYGVRTYE